MVVLLRKSQPLLCKPAPLRLVRLASTSFGGRLFGQYGVPHVQKGAVLIVKDHPLATPSKALIGAFALALSYCNAASAEESLPPQQAGVVSAVSVTFVKNGEERTLATRAHDVAGLLEECGVHAAPGDFVSATSNQPLVDGARISYREAVPVQVAIGREMRHIRSSAASVDDLLQQEHVRVAPSDDVRPALGTALAANEVIRVVRVDTWTAHLSKRVAPKLEERFDSSLPYGMTRTLDAGASGVRDVTVRVMKRDDAAPTRTVVASRLLRSPRPRILVRGTGAENALERVAARGFASAVHFAGNALHMLATAYTAGCAGCSGITASGVPAGFGVIAVDPAVIPLGTKLFIPGYGRAVAGDTGGAINGRRIDLGFDSYVEAMRWGSRSVSVYVLR